VWKSGFNDTDGFLNEFRDQMLRAEDIQVAVCGGELVAVTAILPAALRTRDGEAEPAGCVYALTTLPEHRRRGVAAGLVRSVINRKRPEGMRGVAISPDGPELFGYYARQGWRAAFSVREVETTAETAAARAVQIGAGEYLALRENALEGRDYFQWDARAVRFQESVCRDGGGGLFTFRTAAPCCAAVEHSEDGGLLACELLAPDELLLPCAAGLLERFSGTRIRLRLPPWSGTALGGELLPFGMLFPEDGEPAPLFERLTADRMAYLGFDFC